MEDRMLTSCVRCGTDHPRGFSLKICPACLSAFCTECWPALLVQCPNCARLVVPKKGFGAPGIDREKLRH